MRIDRSVGVVTTGVALVVLVARGASAQDAPLACQATPCAVTFEWGNGNTPPRPRPPVWRAERHGVDVPIAASGARIQDDTRRRGRRRDHRSPHAAQPRDLRSD